MTKRKRRTNNSDLVQWARRATTVLDQSQSMIGTMEWDSHDGDAYWQFALQVGHCVLEGKPLLLLVPEGRPVPEPLKAAASAVEYYIAGNEASVTAACTRAFAAIGIVVKH
jgi:hypothetical protein